MAAQPPSRRPTVHDVARRAGVSLATVDRVLNARRGVRPATVDKVEAAVRDLGFTRDLGASLLARARPLRLVAILPGGGHEFMARLGRALEAQALALRPERVAIETRRVPPFDAAALAAALDALLPDACDFAIVVAVDAAPVRAAVSRAAERGVGVMTLVSDLPGSARRLFVGIDNIAAGRTAAALMGRFCPGGRIGLIAGSLGLIDHRQRLEGFAAVLAADFSGLVATAPREGRDDPAAVAAAARELIARHPDLCGLYAVGAGNDGLFAALRDTGAAGKLRVIVHELTPGSRAALEDGIIDVVIDQDPAGEVRAAVAAARRLAMNRHADPAPEPIAIGIFLRDNLR